MTLNPKLALKSVPSIKTFGAVYKVDTNHAWLLPIDENNRRCKAAGYSGLKDYFIKKGLKISKWKDTGLIKELVTPSGKLMTFDKDFSFSKADNIKPNFKENQLLRTSSCSIKKAETVLSPKRIKSLSPTLKYPVKHVVEPTDNKRKTSQTSIDVYYKMRRSKTLTMLKLGQGNNAVAQERNHNTSNTRKALSPGSGKSLTYLPRVSFSKRSVASSDSADKQNAFKESISVRKFDRKDSPAGTRTSPKLEMRVTRKTCDKRNNRHSGDSISKPSNKKSSLKVKITNKSVNVPPAGNLECDSNTSTSLSLFSARSSVDSFSDKNESVIRIDITSTGTESRSNHFPENVVLCAYVAEGCADKKEKILDKIHHNQTNEKQEQNSKQPSTKSEINMVYSQFTEPATEYHEETLDSNTASVEPSSKDQLSLESANIPYESIQNDNNENDCSVMSTKADTNYLTENSGAELEAVKIVYPTSNGITQMLEISNATSELPTPETTEVALDYCSLIDMTCTLKEVKCTLENMRRSMETPETPMETGYGASEISDVELKADNSNNYEGIDITTRLTILENSDDDANSKPHPINECEASNSSLAVLSVSDRQVSHPDKTTLLLDINYRKLIEKVNSVLGVPRFRTNFPERLFLTVEASSSCIPIIRKLIESPLLTQEVYKRLSLALGSNLCHLQQSMGKKKMLLQEQHKGNRTLEPSCTSRILQNKISYKEAGTQTQSEFNETDDNEFKIVHHNSPEKQNTQVGISYKDAETETCMEDYLVDDECKCKISGDDVREDGPETQNFQVVSYDSGEESDAFSVYEDALE